MTNATRFILSVQTATGRLRVAHRRGLNTTVQEADLRIAQVADHLRDTFSPDQPLSLDHRDMLLALVEDLHRETWVNTTEGVRDAYIESLETSAQYDEMTESFERFVNGGDR
ncbi:hypothetical protein [Nocardioides soli]|uniref:Uncharacterized protein n=1 Tax=Nocardioides soli TaxID=1036020 RepID=A0A7W4Z059_9ACTN|nr:hypothetical protein [Nocardioides soli]MBB3041974.1 hypothetical protein [Nocardioides soli]